MSAYAVLGGVILILLVACVVLLVKNVKTNRNIDKLTMQINDFLNHDIMTPFSLYDNDFVRLQNGVADLQEAVRLEENKLARENKKNMEFISDISHQLKTPIAAIKLYCEMDDEINPTEHNTKELELITKMESLVYQLLKLEKIKTSDIYGENYKSCELSELINSVICEFKPMFPEKKFIVSGKSIIRCSKSWIGEAVSNVIKNACEHTDEDGRVTVEISDRPRTSVIKIYDNGGGANEDDLNNLFVRFYKADNASQKSTGIGLAIAKAVVERHHGVISAENYNDGLAVNICLPHIEANELI